MELGSTAAIRAALREATTVVVTEAEVVGVEDVQVFRRECEAAGGGRDGEPVPYGLLKRAVVALRAREEKEKKKHGSGLGGEQQSCWLHEITAGSRVVLKSPAPREKSPELVERLEQLRTAAEDRAYAAMVSDVPGAGMATPENTAMRGGEGGEGDQDVELLGTYRQQLGFGMQVIVAMGTLYMLGLYVGRRLFDDAALQYLVGVVGLILGMLAETCLFIIRQARLDEKSAARTCTGSDATRKKAQ
eukprot:jgi/Chlat1/8166/Chrsp76S07614